MIFQVICGDQNLIKKDLGPIFTLKLSVLEIENFKFLVKIFYMFYHSHDAAYFKVVTVVQI